MDDATVTSKKPPGIRKRVWICLVVLFFGVCLFTAKRVLFPEHPDSWYRIYRTADLPLSEVRGILSESGARLVSPPAPATSAGTETWLLQHRFGAWTVHVSTSLNGDRVSLAHVRYDSTVFPDLTRMRNYSGYHE